MKFPQSDYQAMTNKTFHPYFYQTCPWRLESSLDKSKQNKDLKQFTATMSNLKIALKSHRVLKAV